MYCKKCGQQIADDSKFCQNCGTRTIHNPLKPEKDKRYIKALETAQTLPENLPKPPPPRTVETEAMPDGTTRHYLSADDSGYISNIYYVEKKSGKVWRKIKKDGHKFIAHALLWGVPAACIYYTLIGTDTVKNCIITILVWFGVWGAVWGFWLWLNWLAGNKKYQRKKYESDKEFIQTVRANGMMVPAPGSKEDYRAALNYVALYELENPNEIEPNRMWITKEKLIWLNSQARSAGRKPASIF
jgi:hypothetical protein